MRSVASMALSVDRLLTVPLRPRTLLALLVVLVCAASMYCLAHSWLTGAMVAVWISIGWAILTVPPWILAFESIKGLGQRGLSRQGLSGFAAAALFLAWLASAWLEHGLGLWAHGGVDNGPGLELLRRLPALILTLLLAAALIHLHAARLERASEEGAAEKAPLPVAARVTAFGDVDLDGVQWIGAAGNYLELHIGERTHLVRMTMAQAEQALDPATWVRVHRSTVVRLGEIAQVQREDGRIAAVVLRSGQRLSVGRSHAPRLCQALSHGASSQRSAAGPTFVPPG